MALATAQLLFQSIFFRSKQKIFKNREMNENDKIQLILKVGLNLISFLSRFSKFYLKSIGSLLLFIQMCTQDCTDQHPYENVERSTRDGSQVNSTEDGPTTFSLSRIQSIENPINEKKRRSTERQNAIQHIYVAELISIRKHVASYTPSPMCNDCLSPNRTRPIFYYGNWKILDLHQL